MDLKDQKPSKNFAEILPLKQQYDNYLMRQGPAPSGRNQPPDISPLKQHIDDFLMKSLYKIGAVNDQQYIHYIVNKAHENGWFVPSQDDIDVIR